MDNITVALGERSYSISIGSHILSDLGKNLTSFGFSKKIALISNPTVFGLYGSIVADSLAAAGFETVTIILPDGEEFKNLSSVENIYGEVLRASLDRKSAIIALGGGVIGDIAGFAASTYMRGIDFIQVPTTLLAQVDSSVGGKTGVNHTLGKNMIGTFWQPRLVWIDIATLRSLPRREFLAGLSEVIKYGIIWDRDFFDLLDADREDILNLREEALIRIVRRSCEIKAEVVSKDERESGLRAILNFGHTIGHAIETATGYRSCLHGEAVALGMVAEAKLAALLGLISSEEVETMRTLITAYGLPVETEQTFDLSELFSSMKLDKKAVSGTLKFILPDRIGRVLIRAGVDENILMQAVESILVAEN